MVEEALNNALFSDINNGDIVTFFPISELLLFSKINADYMSFPNE
jgi:hypothetical protein